MVKNCACSNGVVPTYVGVFLHRLDRGAVDARCPHIRGGVPCGRPSKTGGAGLSPHTWGCSSIVHDIELVAVVVPTYVGVFRTHRRASPDAAGCPHIRGGVPRPIRRKKRVSALSPHTWGCSCNNKKVNRHSEVVPTYVGVFRSGTWTKPAGLCCPHIRGGVPLNEIAIPARVKLSPHTWGCS